MENYTVNQTIAELAEVVAENGRREQEAVQGYTKQLMVIERAIEIFKTAKADGSLGADVADEAIEALSALMTATKEKIADELNHAQSLLDEYVGLTDIEPKED